MDFFSSLNEVRKNSSQLDRWEQQQQDKDAQRKAYQAKHAPTSDEVQRAKDLGETLINVIDTMDDHSESVAENVETIAEPISTVSLIASGGLGQGNNKLVVEQTDAGNFSLFLNPIFRCAPTIRNAKICREICRQIYCTGSHSLFQKIM